MRERITADVGRITEEIATAARECMGSEARFRTRLTVIPVPGP